MKTNFLLISGLSNKFYYSTWKEKRKRLYDCDIVLSGFDIFNYDLFHEKCDILRDYVRYAIIFRVCYGDDALYKTMGSQYGFHIDTDHTFPLGVNRNVEVKEMHESILTRMRESMSAYGFTAGDIISVQLLVSELYYTDDIIKAVPYDMKSIPTEFRKGISAKKGDMIINKSIPRSMDINMYNVNYKSLTIDYLNNLLSNESSSPMKKDDFINNNNDDWLKYVHRNGKTLLTINESTDNDNNKIVKGRIFDRRGNLIIEYLDTYLDSRSFKRKMGSVTSYISSEGDIIKTATKIPMSPILACGARQSYTMKKKINNVNKREYSTNVRPYPPVPGPDYNIGTIDLETYKDIDGISKVYAAGVYTSQYRDKIFYIDKNTINSTDVLYRLFDEVISNKYHKYTFYIHNSGKFDIAFILLPLIERGDVLYKEKLLLRDSTILSLRIDKGGKGKIVVEFVDSYNILSSKLSDLCNSYETTTRKGVFPHKFVNRNKLFYVGPKPDISYFVDYENNIDKTVYDNIKVDNYDLEKLSKEYLVDDLISLYEVITKFKNGIYNKYKVQLTNCRTIASVSMEVFKNNFYDSSKAPIPYISNKTVYKDIKNSYYGGITEVYIPCEAENDGLLYYYDVNSLYPYASLNSMPGLDCEYMDYKRVK